MSRCPLAALRIALCATLLVAALPAVATAQQSSRVINGGVAEPYDAMARIFASYQDQNGSTRSGECGGTLVHPDWVMTAAHCVHADLDSDDNAFEQRLLPPSAFVIGIGIEDYRDPDADDNGERREVTEVVPHPGWRTDLEPEDYVDQSNDLALLRLQTRSNIAVQRFTDTGDTSASRAGAAASLYGYGLNNRGDASDYRGDFGDLAANGTSADLLRVDVPVRSCSARPGLLCAGSPSEYDRDAGSDQDRPPGSDGCNGDSGGPLVVEDGRGGRLQIGLVSYGFFICGYTEDGESAAYTDVEFYADWIHATIGDLLVITPSAMATEGDDVITFDLATIRQPRSMTDVALRTADGSALAGSDYVDTAVTPTLDADGRGEVTVPLLDDKDHEPHETLLLVDDGSGTAIAGPAVGTILDDDLYGLTGADVTVAEPSAGSLAVQLDVALDTPADGFEQFRFVATGGDAEVGSDVGSLGGIVRFDRGSLTAQTTITVLADDAVEATETLVLELRDAIGVSLTSSLTVTITDDDQREVRVLAGEDRLATSIVISRDAFADNSTDTVVIASARSFPDALVGTPLAIARNGPMLLSEPEALEQRVIDEIQRVLTDDGEALLLGGDDALGPRLERQLDVFDIAWRRLAGENRFATGVAVADEIGSVDTVFLATGRNYPDALAAGAAAGVNGGVVLLTEDRTMPTETAAALSGFGGRVVAVGGQAAAAEPAAQPFVGQTRYDTAQLVARAFFDDPVSIGLATGESFPDALSGGVSAGLRGGPMVLTTSAALSSETAGYLDDLEPDMVRVFGGTLAVSNGTIDAVANIVGGRIVR